MPNAKQLLHQIEKKQPPEIFYKNAFLKNFTIFSGKHLCKIFKNTYFEEHRRTAASELTLESHLKPYWLCNVTKIPVAFKTML